MRTLLFCMFALIALALTACGEPQQSTAATAAATQEDDALVNKLVREAEMRKRAALAKSAHAQLQMIRSQLELYYVQHGNQYPDLVARQWQPLLTKTNEQGDADTFGAFGPYLNRVMDNPFTDSTVVAPDASGGWRYNRATGEIWLVVPSDLAPLISASVKHGRDFVVSTADSAGMKYHVEQELRDLEEALDNNKVSDKDHANMVRELPKLERDLADLTAQFNPITEQDKAIEQVTKTATDCGLTVETTVAGKKAITLAIIAQPVQIRVRGTMAQITRWAPIIDDGFKHRVDVFQVIDDGKTIKAHVNLVVFYLPFHLAGSESMARRLPMHPDVFGPRLDALIETIARAKADNLLTGDTLESAEKRAIAAKATFDASLDRMLLNIRFAVRKGVLKNLLNMSTQIVRLDQPTALIKRLIDTIPREVKITDIRIVRNRANTMAFEAKGTAPETNVVTQAISQLNRSRDFNKMTLLTVSDLPKPEGATKSPGVEFRMRGAALNSQ